MRILFGIALLFMLTLITPIPTIAQSDDILRAGWIVYTNTDGELVVSRPDGTEATILTDTPGGFNVTESFARFSQDSNYIVAQNGQHSAADIIRVDLAEGFLTTVLIADEENGAYHPALGPKDRFVYTATNTSPQFPTRADHLMVYDPTSDPANNFVFGNGTSTRDASPDWSPDGQQIIFSRQPEDFNSQTNNRTELWVYDILTDETSNLSVAYGLPNTALQARWSPDGSRVVFWGRESREDSSDIYVVDFAAESLTQITDGTGFYRPVWSPDGNYVIVDSRDDTGIRAPHLIDIATGEATRLPFDGAVWDWVDTVPTFDEPR